MSTQLVSKIELCQQSHSSSYCFEKLNFGAFFSDSAIIKYGTSFHLSHN